MASFFSLVRVPACACRGCIAHYDPYSSKLRTLAPTLRPTPYPLASGDGVSVGAQAKEEPCSAAIFQLRECGSNSPA
jgi:hypothetical protein